MWAAGALGDSPALTSGWGSDVEEEDEATEEESETSWLADSPVKSSVVEDADDAGEEPEGGAG
jgi:hypothetical protein